VTPLWQSDRPPPRNDWPKAGGIARALVRGVPLVVLVFGTLAVLLLLRQIERPVFGQRRPWTPHLTQFVCVNSLRLIGIRLVVQGDVAPSHGAVVANHSSWLDIFVLNAAKRIYFVSKSEVAGWFGIGWLARATGTVFIERGPRHASAQRDLLRQRLDLGHKLMFFPEGTSTDGLQVLPFKSTLFQALFTSAAPDLTVQPVTVHYRAPAGADRRFYGWWGDMEFGPHLIHLLAARRHGSVTVTYHPPLLVADFPDRKALALACFGPVAEGLRRQSADAPAGDDAP